MKISIGSKTILYGWNDDQKRLLFKDDAYKIAEDLSIGKTQGQFFDSRHGMIGWWIERDYEM